MLLRYTEGLRLDELPNRAWNSGIFLDTPKEVVACPIVRNDTEIEGKEEVINLVRTMYDLQFLPKP